MMVTVSSNFLVAAIIGICLTDETIAHGQPPSKCIGPNCRFVDDCLNSRDCQTKTVNLKCVPPGSDRLCCKAGLKAVLKGNSSEPEQLTPAFCGGFYPCPNHPEFGTHCQDGHCCYGDKLSAKHYQYCEVDRPGSCPRVPDAIQCEEIKTVRWCEYDGHCFGKKKCCQRSCGDFDCLDPVNPDDLLKDKPGICPVNKYDDNGCLYKFPDECEDDTNCGGRNKCCEWRCSRKICLSPL